VFVPVTDVVRPFGRVVAFTVPAAELAVVRHDGSLEDIDLTYGELGAYGRYFARTPAAEAALKTATPVDQAPPRPVTVLNC
jgi:hypothetical protein